MTAERWAGSGWVSSRLARLSVADIVLPSCSGRRSPPDIWACAAQGTLAQRGFDPARVQFSALDQVRCGRRSTLGGGNTAAVRSLHSAPRARQHRAWRRLQLGTVLALRAITMASI